MADLIDVGALRKIADKLARAIGHSARCQAAMGPCRCGAAGQQATAMAEYERWKMENS